MDVRVFECLLNGHCGENPIKSINTQDCLEVTMEPLDFVKGRRVTKCFESDLCFKSFVAKIEIF